MARAAELRANEVIESYSVSLQLPKDNVMRSVIAAGGVLQCAEKDRSQTASTAGLELGDSVGAKRPIVQLQLTCILVLLVPCGAEHRRRSWYDGNTHTIIQHTIKGSV